MLWLPEDDLLRDRDNELGCLKLGCCRRHRHRCCHSCWRGLRLCDDRSEGLEVKQRCECWHGPGPLQLRGTCGASESSSGHVHGSSTAGAEKVFCHETVSGATTTDIGIHNELIYYTAARGSLELALHCKCFGRPAARQHDLTKCGRSNEHHTQSNHQTLALHLEW
jgi:hypothetical protein